MACLYWLVVCAEMFLMLVYLIALQSVLPISSIVPLCCERVPIIVVHWIVYVLELVGELLSDHIQFPCPPF